MVWIGITIGSVVGMGFGMFIIAALTLSKCNDCPLTINCDCTKNCWCNNEMD